MKIIISLIAITLILVIGFSLTKKENVESNTDQPVEESSYKEIKPSNDSIPNRSGYRIVPYQQSVDKLTNDPTDWTDSAKLLAEKGHPEKVYLQAVQDTLENFRYIVKNSAPAGLNTEVTNALLGKNQKRWAMIDQNHPRINNAGELVDQWGTAYEFHNVSLTLVEVRSAGPDRIIYTDDDIISDGK